MNNYSIQSINNANKEISIDFERFFAINLDLLCIADTSGIFVRVNKAWKKILGYSVSELEERNFLDFVHPEDQSATLNAMAELRDNKQVINFVNRYRCRDGSYLFIEWCSQPCGGFIYASARDISRRLETERALKEKKENFSTLFETVDDVILISTLDGKVLHGNKAATEKLGYPLGHLKEILLLDCYPEQYKIEAQKSFSELLKQEKGTWELPLQKKDGSLLRVETRMWLGKWGQQDCIYGISKDLTKQQFAFQKFYKLFNCNPAIMAVMTIHNERFADINTAFVEMLQYEPKEIFGRTSKELSLFVDRLQEREIKKRVYSVGNIHSYEIKLRRKNGSILNGLFSGEIIDNHGVKCLLIVIVDQTQQKLAEKELKESEKILSAVALSIKELLNEMDYFKAIENCFRILGEATQVDRVYLFQNSYDDKGNNVTSQKIEWHASVREAQLNNFGLKEVSFEDVETFIEPLLKGESFYGVVREFENDRTREMLEQQEILSTVVLPIYVKGAFWGFIGFDECKYERVWSKAEFSTLSAFTSSVEKAIERRLIEEELEKSKRAADEANAAKSLFLANMSHEVRTPINGVLGIIDLLSKNTLSSEQKVYIDLLRKSTASLVNIINDILDLSKIESGNMELGPIIFEFKTSINEVVEIMKPLIDQKGLEVIINIQEDIPKYLLGDFDKIKQILLNIISNAVKFTSKGSIEISIKGEPIKDTLFAVKFSVKDTGIGISTEKIKTIFEPFVQADNTVSRRYGGTGLGLSICQKLVEMMNGHIWVRSLLNKGTEVHFLVYLEETKEVDFQEGQQMPANAPNASNNEAQRPLHVLVTEDNEVNQMIACRAIEMNGYTYKLAANGKEAIELFDKEKFDVILMDIQMPEMDGYTATRHIRQKEKDKNGEHIIIIALTAHAMKGDSEKCMEAGMDFYLTKPIYFDEIFVLLNQIFGSKQTENKNISTDITHAQEVFEKLNSDESFFTLIIRKFEDDSKELIKEIRQAILNKDKEKLSISAHTLKGAVAVFEVDKALELVKELEMMARRAEFKNANNIVDRVEDTIRSVIDSFNYFIANYNFDVSC